MSRCRMVLFAGIAALVSATAASADTTPQALPFAQDWSNIGLITTDDSWSGVPGLTGLLGDFPLGIDIDPQTVVAPGSGTVDVNANQTNPNTNTSGGVAEFELTNPTVALQGSATADAPNVILYLNTTTQSAVTVSYKLRDIDGSADDAVQQVALQYRVGSSGNFTNVPAGYVADATTGPSLAALVTPVNVTLPSAAGNKAEVQVRIITTNATGSDEWVGVDDISVTGGASAVVLSSFAATRTTKGTLLRWHAAVESHTLGYNVYRVVNGKRVRLNRTLIRACTTSVAGGTHSFVDRAARRGVFWLQSVGLDGSRAWHGSASV
ncbi:MAG: hypothetical protein H0V84_09665 [Actinobacteria bacterium]|nr:hypothetical protein [Actinomycetota bacterium]